MLPQIQTMVNEIRKQVLRNKLRDKISLIDTFLGSMTPPALTLTQGQEYDDHINRVTELINSTRLFLFNVRAIQKKTRTKEIDEFNKSLNRIENGVASINVTPCRWKASKIQHLLDEQNRNNNIQHAYTPHYSSSAAFLDIQSA